MSNILHNATVDTLLERRSIRKFKPKPLSDDIVETLETVAQHAASSQFLNDWSAIRITDPAAKKRLAEIGGQPYIATAPLLYVFVLDDVPALIDLLNLPEYTYPVLGLAIGKPDQDPALKPRMPRSMQFFENEYPSSNETLLAGLQDFDEEVHRYYDLRNTKRPVDPFSDQIASNAVDSGVTSKAVAPNAKRQGFRLER